jgi:DNA repair exonuclease SbcCD ATPase subunit
MAIQDVDDLISQLRRHPEWRDALRREILTEELLSLPQIVRALAEAQKRTEERLETLATRLETLATRLETLATRVQELTEAQKRTEERLETLATRVQELTEAQKRTEGRVGSLDGRFFEREYIDKAYAYFDDILRKIRVLTGSGVAELLDQAEERISRKERKQVMEADIILHGHRLEDKVETYLLGEVSVGIGLEDVHRAAQRAQILARATEKPVISAVGGKRIIPEARELAKELGVSVFLDGGLQSE